MDYSNFPKDLIYIIVSYLSKYDINKFIMSSETLMTVFNKEENWKEMLYINIKDPVIDRSITWRDNYINNLNIETKLNIKIIDASTNTNEYIIFFIDVENEKDELPDCIHDLKRDLNSSDVNVNVAFIKNINGDVAFSVDDHKTSAQILGYIVNKLKIKNSCIGIHTYADELTVHNLNYITRAINGPLDNKYHNIISCCVGDLKVLLMYAPDLS